MTRAFFASLLVATLVGSIPLCSQSLPLEPPHASPLLAQRVDSAVGSESADALEQRADDLRAAKRYFEAADDYRAALAMKPNDAMLYNKLGITELSLQRFRASKGYFERAIKSDEHYADAYNNLGVVEYLQQKCKKAIKQYQKAITLGPDHASYYSNLGAAYFLKKDWKDAMAAYTHALQLDPNVFDRTDRNGLAGRIASPEDRAHFSYVLAKLYAKSGLTEQSLECLRRAMEEGYKGVNEVYSDAEFSQLRKDPRFIQLMADRPHPIQE